MFFFSKTIFLPREINSMRTKSSFPLCLSIGSWLISDHRLYYQHLIKQMLCTNLVLICYIRTFMQSLCQSVIISTHIRRNSVQRKLSCCVNIIIFSFGYIQLTVDEVLALFRATSTVNVQHGVLLSCDVAVWQHRKTKPTSQDKSAGSRILPYCENLFQRKRMSVSDIRLAGKIMNFQTQWFKFPSRLS